MGFETMHAFSRPAMLESLVKFQSRRLHLHPRLQSVGRLGATPDEAVNLFLDVDKRLFHDGFRINRSAGQSKRRTEPIRLTIKGNYLSFFDKK